MRRPDAVQRSPALARAEHLLRDGRTAEAVAALQATLEANPRFAQASFRLGLALEAQGRMVDAVVAHSNAASLQPSLVEARFRAGALYDSLGQRNDAMAAFRRAAAAGPRTSWGRMARVRVLVAEDRDAQAETVLRQILALEPDNAAAADTLGVVLANAGRFDEARLYHERAIAVQPLFAGSYYDVVRCRTLTAVDSGLVDRMQAALALPGLPTESRVKLRLALGKAADDLGDPATAMRHFDEAHAVRSTVARFDAAAFDARIDRLVARASPAPQPIGTGPIPLLVVGLPRSGTTLVEHILSSHPNVHAAGELPFWTERGSAWERAGDHMVAGFATEHAAMLRALNPDAKFVTDKMPLNILYAGLVHAAAPHAVMVHCRRSAIDTALSIHRTYFNQHAALPTGGEALVSFVRSIGRLAEHWRRVLPPHRFVTLDYEDLVTDPEPAIRRLLAACGLEWDAACLHPERNPRVVKTPSKWQARQRISRGAVGGWRRYEPWLGPLAALAE